MTPKQILSASLLDIVFDDRNKMYGAYELRLTYPRRIKRAMLFTLAVFALAITGIALANRVKPGGPGRIEYSTVELSNLVEDPKEPEPIPEQKKLPEPQVKTQIFTDFRVVPEDQVTAPAPEQADFDNARIDLKTQGGVDDIGIVDAPVNDDHKNIIEPQVEKEEGPERFVEVDAKFLGNWQKFLLRNLDPNVPVSNNAPPGTYQVIIEFVVDLEGNVSDIRPLTSHGYGMEQEAIRVLRKAEKWEPAIQNGRKVKAYRKQPVIFQVLEE